MQIFDRYGRPIKNLRVMVTSACNLNCIYCHREGVYPIYHCFKNDVGRRLLSPDEIKKVVEITVKHGVRQVKLTGGEPLLRRDIVDIVRKISEIREIEDISLVTNGHFLANYVYDLKDNGLDRVNVSLPTLNPDKYSFITRYPKKDGVQKVLGNIKKAIEAELNPVKINVVILRGINNDEINDFIDVARDIGAVVQFIELQDPNGYNSSFFKQYFYPLESLEKELEKEASRVIVREMHHRKRFIMEDGVEIEVVRPMFNSNFCAHCTRMRVTDTGEFKPCLMRDDNHVDFSMYLNDPEKIEQAFIKAVIRRAPYFKVGGKDERSKNG